MTRNMNAPEHGFDFYQDALRQLDVREEERDLAYAERCLVDEAVREEMRTNQEFLDSFFLNVAVPRRAHLRDFGEAPLPVQLAALDIRVLELVEADREPELVVSPGFGYGLRVPDDFSRSETTLLALMHRRFMYDDEYQLRPEFEVPHVVYPQGVAQTRETFEARWCQQGAHEVLADEAVSNDANALLFRYMVDCPTYEIRRDGVLVPRAA